MESATNERAEGGRPEPGTVLTYRLSAPDTPPPPTGEYLERRSAADNPEAYDDADAVYHAACHVIAEVRVTIGEDSISDQWEWRPRGSVATQWTTMPGDLEGIPTDDIVYEACSHRFVDPCDHSLRGLAWDVWFDVLYWLQRYHLEAPVHLAAGCWILPVLPHDDTVGYRLWSRVTHRGR